MAKKKLEKYEDEYYIINIKKGTMYIYAKTVDPKGDEGTPYLIADLDFLDDMYDVVEHLINKVKGNK